MEEAPQNMEEAPPCIEEATHNYRSIISYMEEAYYTWRRQIPHNFSDFICTYCIYVGHLLINVYLNRKGHTSKICGVCGML